MKHIRGAVFETNSSSTHSLHIDYTSKLNPRPFGIFETERGYIEIESDEYGWEEETYTSLYSKLSYLYTDAASILHENDDPNDLNLYNPKLDMIRRVVKDYSGLEVVFLKTKDKYHPFGYIDHQSHGEADEAFESDEAFKQFVFSDGSYFMTDNDNH